MGEWVSECYCGIRDWVCCLRRGEERIVPRPLGLVVMFEACKIKSSQTRSDQINHDRLGFMKQCYCTGPEEQEVVLFISIYIFVFTCIQRKCKCTREAK